MDYRKQIPVALSASALVFLLSACGTLKIEPPGPDRQTILVLPVQVTNKSEHSRHGFYYIYDIVDAANGDTVHEAIFKLPLAGDMLIVDRLPPGRYRVDRFIFKTVGSGDFTYGNNVQSRNDRFRLESGKVTVFSQSLNVLLYNKIPGRGSHTTYDFKMQPVTAVQRRQIEETLRDLPNFDRWEMLN